MRTALALLALAAPQDPAALPARRLVLEALDGSEQVLPLDGALPADPRQSGAAFVRYEGLELPAPGGPLAERLEVSLHGGDRVPGWVRGGDEASLRLAPSEGVELSLVLEEIAAVVAPGRLPADGSATPGPAEEGDRIYVRRGDGVDQIDGVLLEFADEGVRFEGRLGERLHPWGEVAALFVEDLGLEAPPPPAVPVILELVGGGRLTGGLSGLDGEGVRLARLGGELALPATLVQELALLDAGYAFLSDLPVADPGPVTLFGTDDDLGMVYPHRVDRNCLDGPLVSGERAWSRGLGVHAPSRLTWQLDGAWARLRATAGIDDSALANRHPGSVVFRVLGDGKELWSSPTVRGGDPLQAVDVSLDGVRELVLEVDPATEAFVSDRANWLRPLLIAR